MKKIVAAVVYGIALVSLVMGVFSLFVSMLTRCVYPDLSIGLSLNDGQRTHMLVLLILSFVFAAVPQTGRAGTHAFSRASRRIAAHGDGVRMRRQLLGLRDADDVVGGRKQRVLRVVDEARLLDEIVDRKRREEARRAARGQHVVRAGKVIAERLGRVVPEEHGAGVVELSDVLERVLAADLEVLRRKLVRKFNRLVETADNYQFTVVAD